MRSWMNVRVVVRLVVVTKINTNGMKGVEYISNNVYLTTTSLPAVDSVPAVIR